MNLSLYLVTDRDLSRGRDIEFIVNEAVKGGVSIVQLREKNIETGEFVDLAKKLHNLLSPLGVPLIINDRVDVALASGAEGVHIGQSDMTYTDARRILGKDKIIGLSVENMEQLLKANETNVDYIAFSPIFSTATKIDTAQPWGLEGVREAVKLCKHPCCAIGGINLNTVKETMECGLDGVAVVSAICSADDPNKSSKELLKIIKNELDKRSME